MKKEFVSYDIAWDLKQLGFNEPCLAVYGDTLNSIEMEIWNDENYSTWIYKCGTPLYQQVFKWFRKKHNLEHQILRTSYGCRYNIIKISDKNLEIINPLNQLSNSSYEEAELECLKKLIKIAKEIINKEEINNYA